MLPYYCEVIEVSSASVGRVFHILTFLIHQNQDIPPDEPISTVVNIRFGATPELYFVLFIYRDTFDRFVQAITTLFAQTSCPGVTFGTPVPSQ